MLDDCNDLSQPHYGGRFLEAVVAITMIAKLALCLSVPRGAFFPYLINDNETEVRLPVLQGSDHPKDSASRGKRLPHSFTEELDGGVRLDMIDIPSGRSGLCVLTSRLQPQHSQAKVRNS